MPNTEDMSGTRRGDSGAEGDIPTEDFRRHAHEVADWMADYLAQVGDYPVTPSVTPGYLRDALPSRAPETGESLDYALADFRELIVPGITHWNHPGFMGYFSITGSGPGILGEMLTAALNVNAMVWHSSPAATELEEVTTEWLRQLLALPDGFEGVINDTASSSSLYALAAAREVAYPVAHESGLFGQPPGRIYASDQTHSSVEKAALTLGFGQDGYRKIPSDPDFRMSAPALRAAIEEDVAAGVKPVAVVATLGTTSSSSIDPVSEIADIAEEFGLWLHVDAAYGGPAAIVPELRPLLAGWERGHSIVVNPHKWLFTPVDCSVLYCRRPEVLVRAFSIVPAYLSTPDNSETRNLMDYGVSLGRRFRSLKLWFVMRYFGREGLIERLRAHVDIARELVSWIDASPRWVRMGNAPLSTVAFRYGAPDLDGDALDARSLEILQIVNSDGAVLLTHTELAGRVALRVSVGNLKTTLSHVENAWKLLNEAAEQVERH
jgi:aromatic-L-amino-acid/L-tryptophan decarboxylase